MWVLHIVTDFVMKISSNIFVPLTKTRRLHSSSHQWRSTQRYESKVRGGTSILYLSFLYWGRNLCTHDSTKSNSAAFQWSDTICQTTPGLTFDSTILISAYWIRKRRNREGDPDHPYRWIPIFFFFMRMSKKLINTHLLFLYCDHKFFNH